MSVEKPISTTNPMLECRQLEIKEKEERLNEAKKEYSYNRKIMDKLHNFYLAINEQYSGNTYLMSKHDRNIFDAYKFARYNWNAAGRNIYSTSNSLFSDYLSYGKMAAFNSTLA